MVSLSSLPNSKCFTFVWAVDDHLLCLWPGMFDLLVVVCGDYLPVHLYIVVLDVDGVSTAGSHPAQRETRNEAIYLTSEGCLWTLRPLSPSPCLAGLSLPRLWPGVGWELKDIYVLTNMLTLRDSWYLKLLESVEFNKWFYVYPDGGRVKASSLHINRPENLSTFKENKFWCHILPFSPRQETNKDQASPSFPYFYIQLQITGREVQSIIVK